MDARTAGVPCCSLGEGGLAVWTSQVVALGNGSSASLILNTDTASRHAS